MMMKTLLWLCLLPLAVAPAALAQSAKERHAFDAEEVTIKTNGYALAGTLLLPKGAAKRPVPAVVTITGSGPQTREGTPPLPGLEAYKPFRQLAEELAARGIAVLRADDRGYGSSTGRETLATATTSTLADDTRAQLAYLRGRREIDPARIALVGHSEGGAIATLVAASDPRVRAVVLMAAMGKTGREVSLSQQEEALAQTPGLTEERKEELRATQRKILQTVIEGGDTSQLPPVASHPWFKEYLTFDPTAAVRRVKQPILILQGEFDRQVTADQAALLERAARDAGNRDVTVKVFPGLNHLFLPSKTGSFNEYATLNTYALGADVLNTLGDWLAARVSR
jgi:dienelactone hydrolase